GVGQTQRESGVQDVADRAREALQLAAGGAGVAVVSSGDPGVFAMASAVFEQAEAPEFADVSVRVVPGVAAAQAAASRVAAPLGDDPAVVSVSERLKPWGIIERRLAAFGVPALAEALDAPAAKFRPIQLAPHR